MGIYDLIQFFKIGHPYCQNMLVTSLYFWESTTNTFQLPCSIITPTLFYIMTIAGRRPTRKIFEQNERNEDTINFNIDSARFG